MEDTPNVDAGSTLGSTLRQRRDDEQEQDDTADGNWKQINGIWVRIEAKPKYEVATNVAQDGGRPYHGGAERNFSENHQSVAPGRSTKPAPSNAAKSSRYPYNGGARYTDARTPRSSVREPGTTTIGFNASRAKSAEQSKRYN